MPPDLEPVQVPAGVDLLATVMCLALPQDILVRPDIKDTLERIGDKTPPPFPGPDRRRLLQLLSES